MPNFAAIEARLNKATMKHLANAIVTLNSATTLGIFGSPYERLNFGQASMDDANPRLTVETKDVPTSPVGKTCTVSGTSYLIAATEPDGSSSGWTTLILELA
jgi:hypothetical protein